jgi:2Fe-2S ferredoxin
MPTVVYVQLDGNRIEASASVGTTVKDAALDAGIEEIVGECGGNAMCATCHVYVEADWYQRLSPPDEIEDELLDDAASPREPTSRLSCQIELSDNLDGLTIRLPRTQL